NHPCTRLLLLECFRRSAKTSSLSCSPLADGLCAVVFVCVCCCFLRSLNHSGMTSCDVFCRWRYLFLRFCAFSISFLAKFIASLAVFNRARDQWVAIVSKYGRDNFIFD